LTEKKIRAPESSSSWRAITCAISRATRKAMTSSFGSSCASPAPSAMRPLALEAVATPSSGSTPISNDPMRSSESGDMSRAAASSVLPMSATRAMNLSCRAWQGPVQDSVWASVSADLIALVESANPTSAWACTAGRSTIWSRPVTGLVEHPHSSTKASTAGHFVTTR